MIQIPVSWNEKKLSEISHKISDGIHTTPIYKDDSDISFINGNNIKNNRIELFNNTKKVGLSEYNKYRRPLGEKTILMSINGTIGNTAFYRNEKVILGKSVAFINLKDTVDKTFISYYLNTRIIKKYWENELTGSTIKNLSIKSIKNANIYLPPLPEQRAIADILSTWDKAIEKMEKLIEAKEKRFKAKSEIFITEIETSHKDILLGDICEIFTAGSKSSEIVQTGKYIIADMGAISGKGELLDRKRSNNNKDLLNIGDLIMPKDDIGGGNIIGKVAYVSIDSVVLGDHVYALRFKENVNSKFIYYQINGRRINRQLRRMSNGTSQLGLGKKDVKIQKIFLPDKNEQNRIANILDNLKREIVLLGQIKIYYKEQKRGLMQKLLTGEWRAKV